VLICDQTGSLQTTLFGSFIRLIVYKDMMMQNVLR
jgi:hypothetical protein